MCGFTGFVDKNPVTGSQQMLQAMTDVIRHRGPDDQGFFLDEEVGLGLGHRRLSIIDLSPEGHQPMTSASGRFVMVYNGEIYNYRELREALGEVHYRGHSDTEVMLAAFEAWGLEPALRRFVGMFAFALWDRQDRVLSLVRDRAGIKPLYLMQRGDALVFGSELKSLMTHRDGGALDAGVLHHYLRLGYVPAPASIFKGVSQLPPGHFQQFDLSGSSPRAMAPQPFWRLDEVVDAGRHQPFEGDDAAMLDAFEVLLRQAVSDRMVADVPLGAFLSGGIDSSLVVSIMQQLAQQPVKTFSIGFRDAAFNEAVQAAEIARHLGTEHHELYLDDRELLDLVPRLPHIWCEPFGDSSQLPTLLLAQFARKHVTVALSGDGGDELAGGYVRHMAAARLARLNGRLPLPLRRLMAGTLTSLSVKRWDSLYRLTSPLLPEKIKTRLPGDKLHKLGRALSAADASVLYREVVSLDSHGSLFERAPDASEPGWWQVPDLTLAPAEDFMIRDFFRYLPDDVLTKVDRATMAASLEARVPLLDHRLVELAWRFPLRMKLRDGVGKWMLREVLARHVPRAMWERPKMGFAAPVGIWLRGPLRDWAEALIDGVDPALHGGLSRAKTRALWQAHLDGQGNVTNQLWHLLMFLSWYEEHVGCGVPG